MTNTQRLNAVITQLPSIAEVILETSVAGGGLVKFTVPNSGDDFDIEFNVVNDCNSQGEFSGEVIVEYKCDSIFFEDGKPFQSWVSADKDLQAIAERFAEDLEDLKCFVEEYEFFNELAS